ncbi:ATP-binding cassette domain-containing protein [Vogesella sp. DC21W]|uniref:ATP-binding cassette domain-containing protein n=1 Tax=Vogesella aquatica TaxID=2984206 RepID=A0ABT5IV52_9NEIS|nr:ATP-binding cassette domain-containing protein [Vogesella aquatica]MDC7716076.1 ATP-binding cassette domain-containing protein [Vogesella aquatica]
MSEIRLQGMHKRFGGNPILADINLTIAPGEFCVFIGPSGCGKSTLLRLIAGLDDASGGELYIDGRCVNDVPPAQRDVAMVFQSYALYPHMTVYDNMAFGLRHLKLGKAEVERRVRSAAESLHLTALLDRKPGALSGGQRQRVAIGRAIVRQPKVFLFDEPLSNLDASLRVKTRVEIARLHRELGRASMVYVTHDQVEAMTLADKIVLLKPLAGQEGVPSIAQVGHPLALYHHPKNRFVAGFMGSPGMNFFPAEVSMARSDGLQCQAGTATLLAAVNAAGQLAGSTVTLGVRPEHVQVGEGSLLGRISHLEHLGEHSYAYLETDLSPAPLVVKLVGGGAAIGDGLRFALPAERVHVFDAADEALPRLAASQAAA